MTAKIHTANPAETAFVNRWSAVAVVVMVIAGCATGISPLEDWPASEAHDSVVRVVDSAHTATAAPELLAGSRLGGLAN